MPNWPLSQEIREHISSQARGFAARVVNLNRLNFPLTVQQIQDGAAGLTIKQIDLIKQLKTEGIETIGQVNTIRVGFLREMFPELRRSLILNMTLPRKIYLRHAYFGSHLRDKDFKPDTKSHIVARLDNLSADERAALIVWLEKLLRQTRINEIVNNCVMVMLRDSTSPTAAHLKHLWPTLTTVIDPTPPAGNGYRSRNETNRLEAWVERFRNPPMRGLMRYEPSIPMFGKYQDLMRLADTQIVAGRMMPVPDLDRPGAICPSIDNWERLPGDITFPLRETA
jgi:hypothetical protein